MCMQFECTSLCSSCIVLKNVQTTNQQSHPPPANARMYTCKWAKRAAYTRARACMVGRMHTHMQVFHVVFGDTTVKYSGCSNVVLNKWHTHLTNF